MLEVQSWTAKDYLAVRELSVIGPVQGVLLQCIPPAAHRLLWSIVGNKAKAQALFSNSLHVDVRVFFPLYFLTLARCGSFIVCVLKIHTFDRLLAFEDRTQYRGPVVPDPKTNRLPRPPAKTDTCTERTVGSITSSAAYRPHGKCHWSIYRGSLLETAVFRPMGNPWSFIRLGLLEEPFHTAEPENTDVSRDGRWSPGSMFLEYWWHHISSRMKQSHFFFCVGIC